MMVNRTINKVRDVDRLYKIYVDKTNEILNSGDHVHSLVVINFNCSICSNFFIAMRTNLCYHVTCHKCMSGPMDCLEECGKALGEPMTSQVFKEMLAKEVHCLGGFRAVFWIKISPGRSFSMKKYYNNPAPGSEDCQNCDEMT